MAARVLLAEDNEPLSRMLQNFLASLKLQVVTAGTGTEALHLLSRQSFDLLLLDLRLPEMNGIEVLKRLRSTQPGSRLPVIVMSGVYKEDHHVSAARRLGIKHYLRKPFSRDEFLQAIRETLAEVQTMPMSVAELLVQLFSGRKTGTLSIHNCPPIFVLHGEPCSFQTRNRDEFAQYLQILGLLQPSEKEQFAASGEERIFFNQAGYLSYEDLVEKSRLYLSKCLVDSLDSRNAAFTDGVCVPEMPLVSLAVPRLLYDALRSHPINADSFMDKYGACYPGRTTRFYRLANYVAMSNEDIDILGAINGHSTVREIISGRSQHQAPGFFRYLLLLGMIDMHAAPTPEATADFCQKYLFNRPLEEVKEEAMEIGFDDLVDELSKTVEIAVGDAGMAAPLSTDEIGFEQTVLRDHGSIKDKNYYEVLGLTQATFSFDGLKDAYFAKSRQYSPERFMELSGATQNMAQEILAVYSSAYNTLSSVVAKERYDEMLNSNKVGLAGKQDDKLQARIQFQSGKVFLEMSEFDNAEKCLQDAYTLEPENAMHCAYLAWAIYRNPASKASRSAMDKARSLLSRSLQLEKNADAFAFRGWILLDEGRDGLAEGEFQKALKLNPGETNARQGLRLIEDKREAQNKGFFRKMFS